MKDDEVKYVRFGGKESILAKKDILSVQMSLLRILKALRNFSRIRSEELKAKSRLLKVVKETNSGITRIEANIPKLTTSSPRKGRKMPAETREFGMMKKAAQKDDYSLESQLREIQDKLKSLQG